MSVAPNTASKAQEDFVDQNFL